MRELRRLSWDEPAPGDLIDSWVDDELDADDTPRKLLARTGRQR